MFHDIILNEAQMEVLQDWADQSLEVTLDHITIETMRNNGVQFRLKTLHALKVRFYLNYKNVVRMVCWVMRNDNIEIAHRNFFIEEELSEENFESRETNFAILAEVWNQLRKSQ